MAGTVGAGACLGALGGACALGLGELYLEAAEAVEAGPHLALVDTVDVTGAGHAAEAANTEHSFGAKGGIGVAVSHRGIVSAAHIRGTGLAYTATR